MWNSFLICLKTNIRAKAALFWLFAFPLILATLFNAMFGHIAESYELGSLNVAVVKDDAWSKAAGAHLFVDGIAGLTDGNGGDGENGGGKGLITTRDAASANEAVKLMRKGTVDGTINATADGKLHLSISKRTAGKADPSMGTSSTQITLTVLRNLIARYNATDTTIRRILATNPQSLTDPSTLSELGAYDDYTRETTLTHFKPDATARYFYALFGMVSLMAMSFAINSITATQANLSALGVRQSISPLPKWKQVASVFLVSWICSFASLFVLLLYIRYVCHIGMGGREAMAVLGIAVAAFMSSGLGLFLGAIPKLDAGTKTGISIALSCFLSLFAGLYGVFAMDLSDFIDRNMPVLSVLNPAKQVTNLFYDLMYFDSYRPFFQAVGILTAFGVASLAIAALLLRRQRYDYL